MEAEKTGPREMNLVGWELRKNGVFVVYFSSLLFVSAFFCLVSLSLSTEF